MGRPAGRRMRRQVRAALGAVAVLGAVACSSQPQVRVIEAGTTVTSTSTTMAPTSTSAPETVPTDSVDTAEAAPETSAPAANDPDGVGDVLYPSLGSPGIDVLDYDIDLAYDPVADTVAGSVTITLVATRPGTSFTLDAVDLEVGTVTVAGADAAFTLDDAELRITPATPLDTGAQVDVVVAYTAAPDAGAAGGLIPSGWFHSADGAYVLNEPDGARTWLPSNDHPSDKATYTFRLTVPEGETAVANGMLVSSEPTASGETTWVWRNAEPMATYLIQVLVGDYEILRSDGPGGLPLVSVVLRDLVDSVQPCLDTMTPQIEFFEQLFGPYPFDQYGLAITDSFGGLAMETQGRSLFSRDDLGDCAVGGGPNYVQELLLAHELAHQWYGNAVTLGVWQDIWLNESFASYAQWLWFDHAGIEPLDEVADYHLANRSDDPSANPTGLPGVDEMFGYNSYDGGAVVLHALRREIGDDAFFEVLRRWVGDNVDTSRRTADFITLAGEVAGRDLDDFFDTWLYSRVIPAEFPAPG